MEQSHEDEKKQLLNNEDTDDGCGGKKEAVDHLKQISDEYNMVLQESISTFNKIGNLAIFFGIDYVMRNNIFVLYAQTFDDCANTSTISIIIYLSYFMSGLFSLIFGIIGDVWRFDYLFVIAGIIDVTAFWIEATSNTFILLAVAYIIGGQAIQAIVYAYSTKYLPTFYNKQFQSKWMQYQGFANLLAPTIGGILSDYISYRGVFYTTAIISSILLLVTCIIIIQNTQKKLNNIQNAFKIKYDAYINSVNINININVNSADIDGTGIYDNEQLLSHSVLVNKAYIFPLVLNKKNDDNNINNEESDIDKSDKIDKIDLIVTFLCIIGIGVICIDETALSLWYLLYVKETFNYDTLYGTLNISLFAVSWLSAYILIDFLIINKKYNNKKEKCILFVLVTICQLVKFVFVFYIIPDKTTKNNYFILLWFDLVVIGFCTGCVLLSVVIVFLEVLPTRIAGTVSGLELFIQYSIKAIGALLVGILWNYSHKWLWYTMAIEIMISSILFSIIVSLLYQRVMH